MLVENEKIVQTSREQRVKEVTPKTIDDRKFDWL